MESHACNLSIQETEAGQSQIGGQLELHSKTLGQKKKIAKITNQSSTGFLRIEFAVFMFCSSLSSGLKMQFSFQSCFFFHIVE
jgi:hypothetical protein